MASIDWVKERAACSPGLVFEKLKLEVTEDLASIKALNSRDDGCKFAMEGTQNAFVVSKEGRYVTPRFVVIFRLTDTGIAVEDSSGPLFKATLTLNDEGNCRLKINGKECELWQVRMMALESLFFEKTV